MNTFLPHLVSVVCCVLMTSLAAAEPPTVRLVSAPPGARPIVARVDPVGRIHLLADSERGPMHLVSEDDGHTFSTPRLIPIDRMRLGVDQRLSFMVWDMAIGKGGVLHVALGSPNAWKLKLPHDQWGWYHIAWNPQTQQFSALQRVNRRPSEGFSLAASPDGQVVCSWLADRLYVNVSRDNGATFEDACEFDPQLNPCNCCTTATTFGTDGRLALLYRDEVRDERDMYLVLSDQAKGPGERRRVSTTPWKIPTCPMTYYSLTPTPTGYVAAWPTGQNYQVYWAALDHYGKVLPPGEMLTPGQAWHRTGVLALSKPTGETVIAWAKDERIGWQVYDQNHLATGKPGGSASLGTGVAGVVTRDGSFLLFRGVPAGSGAGR